MNPSYYFGRHSTPIVTIRFGKAGFTTSLCNTTVKPPAATLPVEPYPAF